MGYQHPELEARLDYDDSHSANESQTLFAARHAVAKAINDKMMEYRSRAFLFVLGLSSVHASTEARLSRVCSDPIAHVSTGGRLGDVTSAVGERGIGSALFNQEPRRKHVIGVLAIASKLQLPWLALMALIPTLRRHSLCMVLPSCNFSKADTAPKMYLPLSVGTAAHPDTVRMFSVSDFRSGLEVSPPSRAS